MRLLITGATGFVGRKLVSRLIEQGHSVSILGRDANKAAALFGNAVTFYPWKPEHELAPAAAFEGVESVIHLAGEGIAEKRWSRIQKDRIYNSRIMGTRNLVKTLNYLGAKCPKSFISASAIGFYGDRGDEQLNETSSAGTGFLSNVCRDWEEEIFKANRAVRTVALRIGIVLGREGGALKKLLPIFQAGLGGPVGNGRQWMSWIHVQDLVSLFIEAAQNENYKGPINAVAPKPITNSDFSKALGHALRRPAILPAPAFALRLLMGELSVLVLSSQKVVPGAVLVNGFNYQFGDIRLALEEIAKKKEQVLEKYQIISRPNQEIFPFFCDEKNLETLTPPWLHFRVLGKTGETLNEGTVIDYTLKVRGVPMRWRSRILEWDRDRRFVDEQVRGPYRSWHHTHDFMRLESGTLMRDRIRYEVPRIPFFKGLIEWFVARDLERIFAYRRVQIEEYFKNERMD